MASIEKSVEVNVPLRTAYNQWTQFEEFPRFMQGVEEVRQIDTKRLYWHAEIGGKDKEWEAEIVEQTPDQRLAWRSITGAPNGGIVTFEPLEANRTRVTLQMDYEPEGFVESVGSALGLVSGRVEGDLQRFKEYIESRGSETGAWRGEVHGGQEENSSTSGFGTGAVGGTAAGFSGDVDRGSMTTGSTGYGATTAGTTDYDTTTSGTANYGATTGSTTGFDTTTGGTAGTAGYGATTAGTTDYDTTTSGTANYGATTGSTTDYDTTTSGTTGAAGYGTSAGNLDQGGEIKVPIVEEDLHIGTREVEGGGVRVTTRVEEVPVNEQVTLREETVDVHRRTVDRPVSEADLTNFQEGTFEVRERSEEVVTDKQARVVEEVTVRKDVQERTENVQDTVRRTDVDVDQPGDRTRTAGYQDDSTLDEGRSL